MTVVPPSGVPAWSAPTPTSPLNATVVVPGSKSETNRALVLAALADGSSTITGGLASRDADLMRAALVALGVGIDETQDGSWVVSPPDRFQAPSDPIECGLAGTVMRFVPPIAALTGASTRFVGDDHASARPMEPLLEALGQLGCTVEGAAVPFTLTAPARLSGRRVVIDSSGSSQFVSALLLTGARFPDGVEIAHHAADGLATVPSRPHIDMTLSMLRDRGVRIETPDHHTWSVAAGPIAALDQRVEPDLTNAAAFLAAAAIAGGQVSVPGWPQATHQGGAEIVAVLQRMGAQCELNGHVMTAQGRGNLTGAGVVDLHGSSELTPVVAALAAVAQGETTITGVAHIRGHETDRLAALVAELGAVGAQVRETEDGLHVVGRGPEALTGALWHAYADHRMAHAGALVGLVVPDVAVDDIACTSKTIADFPSMWADMVAGR